MRAAHVGTDFEGAVLVRAQLPLNWQPETPLIGSSCVHIGGGLRGRFSEQETPFSRGSGVRHERREQERRSTKTVADIGPLISSENVYKLRPYVDSENIGLSIRREFLGIRDTVV